MRTESHQTVKILSSGIRVWDGDREEARISLSESPALRSAVWDFALASLDEGLASLFHHVCGRCGACCAHFSVYVGAPEIYAIRRHLGMQSDEEFRDAFLEPSTTWNPFDGFLKKSEGACPFLHPAAKGRPASCSIYPVRPRACAAHLPAMEMCRKDPAKLFSHLWHIALTDGRPTFAAGINNEYTIENPSPRLHGIIDMLYAALENVGGTQDARIDRLFESARRILDRCAQVAETMPAEDLVSPLSEVEKILVRMSCLLSRERKSWPEVDSLWGRLRLLQCRLAREKREEQAGEISREEADLYQLTLYPQCLTVDDGPGKGTVLRYDEHPPLLSYARTLLREIALCPSDDVQRSLTEPEPPCYLCGDCCRMYCVEIGPRDVERLAENLDITEDEFKERYTTPARFSWNRGCVVLKKGAAASKESCALEPGVAPRKICTAATQEASASEPGKDIPGGENPPCVFLERREDGWYCEVHAFKPDVCRVYSTTNRFCRTVSNPLYWHRQAGNVMTVTLTGDTFLICTTYATARGEDPCAFREEKPGVLAELAARLNAEVAGIIGAAQTVLK
jgi:Fe-S-cluster containining protein